VERWPRGGWTLGVKPAAPVSSGSNRESFGRADERHGEGRAPSSRKTGLDRRAPWSPNAAAPTTSLSSPWSAPGPEGLRFELAAAAAKNRRLGAGVPGFQTHIPHQIVDYSGLNLCRKRFPAGKPRGPPRSPAPRSRRLIQISIREKPRRPGPIDPPLMVGELVRRRPGPRNAGPYKKKKS